MQSIQEQFDKQIEKHLYHYYYKSLGLYDWQTRVEARKNEVARSKAILKTVEEISSFSFKGKKMLDVGCGWGGYVVAGLEIGMDACGCDVDEEVLDVARLRSRIHKVPENFFKAPAEKLPFADETFDYVQCITVLEHVDDIVMAIDEIVRVLKRGSIAFIQAPNYWQPIERHYKIPFLPKCPKGLAKIYLKLLGRPTKFLDHLNYIDYKTIYREFKKRNVTIEDIEKKYNITASKYNKLIDDNKISTNVSNLTYNAMVTRIMRKLSFVITAFFENCFNVRQIYFLIRKN